jgi:hypothetical protein
MALFGRLSDCLHRCDQLHRTRASASTLGKALLEDQFLALQQELFAMQGDLHQLHTLAQARLPAADALLKSTPSGVPSETAQLCRELIYLERWSAQVDSQLHRFL